MENKLLFLGTCAADFSPKLKDEFKDSFDNDARRASCALLNERYLIDCGPHVLDSIRIAGVDMSKITDVFITHFHADHLNFENLKTIVKNSSAKSVKIWVRYDGELPEIPGAEIIKMDDLKPYDVGDGLTVTGFNANHDEGMFPHHFLFQVNGKNFFYGLDGGWFLNKSYNYLRNFKLDLIVFDATCGDYEGDYRMGEHNSIPMIRQIVASFKTVNIINEKTLIYLSHLAPSLHKPHKETSEIVEKDGLNVAYDGLSINF